MSLDDFEELEPEEVEEGSGPLPEDEEEDGLDELSKEFVKVLID